MILTGPLDAGPYDRPLFWPNQPNDNGVLSRVSNAALRSKQAVIKTRSSQQEKSGAPLDAMACPLFIGGKLLGVLALEMTHRTRNLQQTAARQVQAGAKWLEAMIRLQGAATDEQLIHLVEMVAVGLENPHFRGAATEVTNELAQRFNCKRVSLGFLNHQQVRVEAISHSSHVDQHSAEVRSIKEAMLEAIDNGAAISFPTVSQKEPRITRFHSTLSKSQHDAALCTIPLVKNGEPVGALLFERTATHRFDADTVNRCEQIGLLLGPLLENRRRTERPLRSIVFDSVRSGLAKIFGPRHLPIKVAAAGCAALMVWLSMAGATLRIPCEAELEAKALRVIAAPQQGYIATANVRAGDMVRKGDLMATLDDKELRIEQRKWQSQGAQLLKEYHKALAGFDRAEVAIIKAKRAQAEAQLGLIEQQLARTTMVAPFAGIVVDGDLSQSLGSPVSRGDALFQVAPTDEYRVVLKVDDRDIGLIDPGMRGQLKLSGIPDRKINITVDRLTPVSMAEEGRHFFRVEATMEQHSDLMRPGMKGISKIEIGQTRLLWAWTRRIVDGVRLFAWKRLP